MLLYVVVLTNAELKDVPELHDDFSLVLEGALAACHFGSLSRFVVIEVHKLSNLCYVDLLVYS